MATEHESKPQGYPAWQWILAVLFFLPLIPMLIATVFPQTRPTLRPARIWAGYFLFASVSFILLVVLVAIFAPTPEAKAEPADQVPQPVNRYVIQPTATPKPTAIPKPPDVSKCFSAWDGHHRKFTDLVKTKLNDPGSLEAIETKYRTYPNAEGLHYVYMDFTAKNLFGGRVRHLAKGWFHPKTCETILISIE